jgi:heme/copper-type cytochrome/quinol oxidase subunit 3
VATLAQPIATRRRASGIPTGRLAMWWLLGSEIVIFGGLLMCYLLFRLSYEHWHVAASHTNTLFGAINTFVLLTSSLFAVLAHQAAEAKQGVKAFAFLWLTIGGGLTFLAIKSVEWTMEISAGYTMPSNLFWAFYYTAAGIHASHVIGGMIAMAIVSFDALKGRNLQRVELVGLYWHFVDIVWIFLFPLLYIAK